jgi:transcription initiation factor IIF auxiliary subunit
MMWPEWIACIVAKRVESVRADRDRLAARVVELESELALWKPLTPEEAEKALAEAKAVPLSEDRLREIMERALDPAETLPNNEQAQLVVRIKAMEAERDHALAQALAECERIIDLLTVKYESLGIDHKFFAKDAKEEIAAMPRAALATGGKEGG